MMHTRWYAFQILRKENWDYNIVDRSGPTYNLSHKIMITLLNTNLYKLGSPGISFNQILRNKI